MSAALFSPIGSRANWLTISGRTQRSIDWLPRVRRSADPADDFLLALCEAGRADYLVTGDKTGLLVLGTHGGTTILTAREFLDRLGR